MVRHGGCEASHRSSSQGLLIAVAKVTPIAFSRRHKTVPVQLETVGAPPHGAVQRGSAAPRAQVIAIGFVLLETNDFAIAQFAQKRDISFADRPAEVSAAREQLGLFQKISGSLIRLEPLSKDHPGF